MRRKTRLCGQRFAGGQIPLRETNRPQNPAPAATLVLGLYSRWMGAASKRALANFSKAARPAALSAFVTSFATG